MKSLPVLFGVLISIGAASAQQYIVSTVAGTGGSPGWSGDGGPALSAQFQNPDRVAVDKQGNLYIADYSNYSVRKVGVDGTVSAVAGNGSFGYAGDGSSSGSQLSTIHDVAVDAAGNVYIADTLNSRVRMVNSAGTISTVAGNGSRGYDGDGGPAANATLYFPAGLALDSAGNLYIADYGNATVRKVDRNGSISTVAGVGYSVFGAAPGDGGPANKAFLEMPFALGVDAAGNIYIGDIGTSTIRRVGTDGKISTFVTISPLRILQSILRALSISRITTTTRCRRSCRAAHNCGSAATAWRATPAMAVQEPPPSSLSPMAWQSMQTEMCLWRTPPTR